MNIHEYQAKELLAKFGVAIPAGYAAMSVDEAVAAAEKLPGPLYVVKAQIHAGGRGKGKFKELPPEAKGGVRLAKTFDDVRAAATDMLGNTLVTIQTGEHGKQVNRLYVTDGVDIARELYLALLVDRGQQRDRAGRLDRGRHGHRARRRAHARAHPHLHGRPRRRHPAAPRAQRRLRARPDRRPRQAVPGGRRAALRHVRRDRRGAGRDQPARRHRRREAARPRRQGRLRLRTRCSATPTSPSSAT